MSEFRRDPVTGLWVIISTDRHKRPNDFRVEKPALVRQDVCPFCAGREQATPPEVFAARPQGSVPNGPGWELRVVPNKFPALRVEGTLERAAEGMFDRMSGVGAHEVIIESPDHARNLASMSEAEIERVLWAFRERIVDLTRDIRFRSIIVFKNHGAAAGATLEHSHSQLIALPIVPDFVRQELDGAKRHFAEKERCVFCDILRQEIESRRRVVHEDSEVVAFAPYASRFPFEAWLLPRRHAPRFEEASREEYQSLARTLKAVLTRMNRALEEPAYNFIIHSAPVGEEAGSHYHWHLELAPRIARTAGFEWATGFYINPTSPEEATEVLRAFSS